jgi:hypothetical protein
MKCEGKIIRRGDGRVKRKRKRKKNMERKRRVTVIEGSGDKSSEIPKFVNSLSTENVISIESGKTSHRLEIGFTICNRDPTIRSPSCFFVMKDERKQTMA